MTMEPQASMRSVFYISDGTGITAETLGHSLLTQFEGVRFKQARIPFVDTPEKAHGVIQRIEEAGRNDGAKPIVFTTLVNPELAQMVHAANALCLSFIETFVAPMETELGVKSTHSVGRSHGSIDTSDYKNRIEAINYTLAHDDGITDNDLEVADVILVGVSRCGKTPTSLYLAMQFGLKAANFPLIPEDFDRGRLPGTLERHRAKLFGLTIQPERLAQIREERRPNSNYASLKNCRQEVHDAEKMMKREGIRWLDSSTKSIEEISTTVMQEVRLDNRVF
jgi:regulator of PEP synthase PpsR (kinase-PPPase family)